VAPLPFLRIVLSQRESQPLLRDRLVAFAMIPASDSAYASMDTIGGNP